MFTLYWSVQLWKWVLALQRRRVEKYLQPLYFCLLPVLSPKIFSSVLRRTWNILKRGSIVVSLRLSPAVELNIYLKVLLFSPANGCYWGESINQLFFLFHAGKAARIPMKSEKDGYERILTLINISYIVACVALIPSLLIFFSFVRNSLTTPVFCVFDKLALLLGFTDASKEIPSTFLKVLWFFLVGTANINGALNMNLFVNFAVIYTNSTKLWMTKLWWERVHISRPRFF